MRMVQHDWTHIESVCSCCYCLVDGLVDLTAHARRDAMNRAMSEPKEVLRHALPVGIVVVQRMPLVIGDGRGKRGEFVSGL